MVWLADYEAWGNTAKVVWREEKLGQLKVSAEQLQPIRFQGQSFNVETGLHYNRFRYFDPDLGMFTTRDPIGLLGGNNVFQYAPNPVGWVDPFGLKELFRSMNRDEYFDIKNNGWDSKGNMNAKWFAESYDDAVEWGNRMGHGNDSKFYVVGFEIDDEIASKAYMGNDNHDGIGKARAIDIEDLNKKPTPVTSIHSQRVECSCKM